MDSEAWLQNLAYLVAVSGNLSLSPPLLPPSLVLKSWRNKGLLIKSLRKPKTRSRPCHSQKVLKSLAKIHPVISATPVAQPLTMTMVKDMSVRINNPNYLPEVEKLLKAQKVTYTVVDVIARNPSLDVEINKEQVY